MKQQSEYRNVINELNNIPQFVNETGIVRSARLLKELGNPENKLKIIHIAGTNGKGSVCAYLNSILINNGYRTGLFTSPHLKIIRERIRIDSNMISEAEFVKYYKLVMISVQKLKDKGYDISYFDILLAIAVCYFSDRNVEFMVMETGLGGRLDSTNAILHPRVSVITTISLEHTAILGDTVEKIAFEKAGIIKPEVPVLFLDKDKAASAIIENTAEKCNCVAYKVSKDMYQIKKINTNSIDFSIDNEYYKNDCFTIHTRALYQVENCCLSLCVIKMMQHLQMLSLNNKLTKDAVFSMRWKGRMEQIGQGIYVDGAHNPEGIKAFLQSAKSISNGEKCCLLFSVVNDKNHLEMVRLLCESELFDHYVLSEIDGKRKLNKDDIIKDFRLYTDADIDVFDDTACALQYAITNKKHLLFCTGSLYLVGEIEKRFNTV